MGKIIGVVWQEYMDFLGAMFALGTFGIPVQSHHIVLLALIHIGLLLLLLYYALILMMFKPPVEKRAWFIRNASKLFGIISLLFFISSVWISLSV